MHIKAILPALRHLSLSTRIILGLVLGIFTGLFFGEPAEILQPIADIYIRLMQMTVLPYLVMSLIIGFGQLNPGDAKRLAVRSGILLALVWGLSFLVIAAMPATFPAMESASFFSTALTEPEKPFSIADLYFTSNPFYSLSNAVIPAVVLFSSLIGIGLIGLENRERVLEPLRVLNASIVIITRFIIGLTPIGVFAIGAVTAGTMSPETLVRLEVYFITFGAASLLLTFLILPLLVTALTPFRYREIIAVGKDALLTAFVTHNAFIVLPLLVDRTKVLLRKHRLLNAESGSAAELLVPILFNFPNAGRLLTLLFVPFAAWLAGNAFTASDYASLFAVGVPTYFAKAQVALPFLLDFFGQPHDLFHLYIPTTVITGKFDSMVTAMNLLVFALLGAGAMGGFIVMQGRRLLGAGALMLAAIVVSVIGLQLLLDKVVDTSYHKDEMLRQMQADHNAMTAIIHRNLRSVFIDEADNDLPPLKRILERGTLRVGYDPSNLPFSFFNQDDDLVGFDVELSRSLAESMGVMAEFIPIDWTKLPEMLEDGTIDVMPGTWYRPFWFPVLRLSAPYLVGTMALAVRDERRHEFKSVEDLRRSQGLKIGVPLDLRQVIYSLQRYFDNADVEFITLEFWRPFFEGQHPELDAFLVPAENGSAWTLLHPEYTIVVPQPDPVKVPSAFGLALDAEQLESAVNEWVVFATNEGMIDRAYDYWVLGQGASEKRPRWSILRDVLGWQD
jgi:Na+/H+-dicarboxylate symporter/ABC-type amino acid transport substrate-binding protein